MAVQSSHVAIDQSTIADQNRTTHRLRVRIPKTYSGDPVISRLTSHYRVTVNIWAALLDVNANNDGWFDLELHGTAAQIRSALIYLNELDLELWPH